MLCKRRKQVAFCFVCFCCFSFFLGGTRLREKLNMQSVKCLTVYFCRFLVFLFWFECESEECLCTLPEINNNNNNNNKRFFLLELDWLQFGCRLVRFSRVKSFLPKQAACNDINTVYFWKIKQEISGHFYPPPLIINKLDAKCFFGMKPFTYWLIDWSFFFLFVVD